MLGLLQKNQQDDQSSFQEIASGQISQEVLQHRDIEHAKQAGLAIK